MYYIYPSQLLIKMRVHFFTGIDQPYRFSFLIFYTLQNLQVVKIVSFAMFLINIALRLFVIIGNVPIQTINNIQEYDSANWISLAISPLFYFGSLYLIKNFERSRKSIIIGHGFVLAFCLFLMITTMRSTFFVMHNPRNTFVMYFMGMIVTAVFFTLEFYETMFLVAVTGICFAAILP